ncbi:Txe/YoeB family addiction module toxin [Mucilaginibacter ginsenosidivorax]|uniref:Putative mRNA interferase YoeB n=1 Tax=Mucilaginibacter ginsenosidivorax TaxID=862126 RepID=A0A5B8VZ84_9SPHI|nr:Txe/YoeB family addiction module toxin [Mucilaginibacter ginsenosidivorax]QEC75826.1 Txe/YoeB family addiction module toxin [Mucilaginibacter ginsenosidivorax]
MIVEFTRQADEDLAYFKKSGNKQAIKKIKELLEAITNNPYHGIGQPEQLKHGLSGAWSRRINQEHRLVYEIDGDIVYILSLKGHY